MKNTLIKSLACLNLIAVSLALSGCGGGHDYNKRYYVLDTQRQPATQKPDNQFILEIRRFTIDSAFASKDMVHRIGPSEYKTDFYNEFLVSPQSQITEKTRTWLAQSGIFHTVLDRGSAVEPTHTLTANVTALYGDFRNLDAPRAVMELRVFLIDNRTSKGSIVFGATYDATCSLETADAENLAKALDTCLGSILSDLEKDIQRRL